MRLRQALAFSLAGMLYLLPGLLAGESLPVLAIENARIVPVSGAVIERGTIVVREGLIEAVGADVKPPADAWVMRGEGLTVYPGLIDGLSTWGLPGMTPEGAAGGGRRGGGAPPTGQQGAQQQPQRAWGPEDRPLNTSYLLAADLLSTGDRRLESARNAGFTGAVAFPNKGIFAGEGAVIGLAGERPGNMVVASPAGLYLTMHSNGFGGGFPGSIMGVIAYIRQIYLDADYYKMAKGAYETNPRGLKRPDYDKTLEGVLLAPRVLLPASSRKEVDRMVRFAAELKVKPVLYGGHGIYEATDLLQGKDVPVLVNLQWPEKARDADPEEEETLRVLELRDKAPSSPAALEKAGVKYAFYSGAIERPADIRKAAKRAITAGLTREQAVRAMTLSVAEIFGVADRIGSIEKGKIANLTVMKGDLFDDSSEVKCVVIDGAKFEPQPEAPARGGEVTR